MGVLEDWIRSILAFSLLASCFQQLLPEGKGKEYGKFFCGLLLILLVLRPVLGGELRLSWETLRESFGTVRVDPEVEAEILEAGEKTAEEAARAWELWALELSREVLEEEGLETKEHRVLWEDDKGPALLELWVRETPSGLVEIDPVKIGSSNPSGKSTELSAKLEERLCRELELERGQVRVWQIESNS